MLTRICCCRAIGALRSTKRLSHNRRRPRAANLHRRLWDRLLVSWCCVFREWVVTKAMQDHPKVSSVDRAPDLESGCHGFDSRTAPQAENLLPREGNRRESVTLKPKGSGRPVGRPRVVVLVSTRRQCCGNTYRRYTVRGYRLHACRIQKPWKLSVV